MAVSTPTKIYVLYSYIIIIHSVKPLSTTGTYFKVTKGTHTENSIGDTAPLIRTQFFQCGREQSCSHVLQIANGYIIVHGSEEFRRRKHEAMCIYEKVNLPALSCLDFYRNGFRKNGIYEFYDEYSTPLKMLCDFESEANSVWTLVESFSLQNKALFQVPFSISHPRKASKPNWVDYRLGLDRMKYIRSASTMWRATCSFPTYKSGVYRDYMKAEFKELDILAYNGLGICSKMLYINIRGHEGRNVTVQFWAPQHEHVHTDTSYKLCEFNGVQGSIPGEDNFGNYIVINRAFRCTESDESTTQYWFGEDA